MLALWTTGASQKVFIGIALLWIAACASRRRHSTGGYGLSTSGIRESAWVVLVALTVAGILLVAASSLGTLHVVVRGRAPELSIGAYTLWALLQEFILLNVFFWLLLRLLPTRMAAVIATAALFALAHVPNPMLFAITLLWGATSCVLFLRYRNLYTLALAHAIIGLTLAVTIPDAVQHQMRVGIGYLHWHAPTASVLAKPQ